MSKHSDGFIKSEKLGAMLAEISATRRTTPHTIEEMEQELKEKRERLHCLKSEPMIYVGTGDTITINRNNIKQEVA